MYEFLSLSIGYDKIRWLVVRLISTLYLNYLEELDVNLLMG